MNHQRNSQIPLFKSHHHIWLRKTLSITLTILMVLCLIPQIEQASGTGAGVTADASSSIGIGDYVQMGTYYDKPILWRCVDIDENGPLMLSDKIISVKAYDAAGDNLTGSHGRGYREYYRTTYGSDYWGDSNIRCWLNSKATAGNVEWKCGNPPSEENVWNGYDEYADEAGFLTNFTANELNVVKEVTQDSLLFLHEYDNMLQFGETYHTYNDNIEHVVTNANDGAYKESVTDKIFLMDVNQVYAVYKNRGVLGDDYYIGEPTAEAVEHSEFKGNDIYTERNWYYWLRSPYGDQDEAGEYVRCVYTYGDVSYADAYADSGHSGVRPAFYLNSSSADFADGNGSSASPYKIEASSTVTTPATEPVYKSKTGEELDQWAKESVDRAIDADLMPASLSGTNLKNNISRVRFAGIAVKLYEQMSGQTVDTTGVKNPFTDTQDADVLKAYSLGVTNGTSATTFSPSNQLTREEASTMLLRIYTKLGGFVGGRASTFNDDASISAWAKDAVYFMAYKNILYGVGDNTFSPKGKTQSQQALVIAVRMLDNLKV